MLPKFSIFSRLTSSKTVLQFFSISYLIDAFYTAIYHMVMHRQDKVRGHSLYCIKRFLIQIFFRETNNKFYP